MKVKSNIGLGDYFDRDQDLVLTWAPDPSIERAYLAICVEGIPCILKEVTDNGELTVTKDEFVNFPSGARIFIHMGRGIQYCFGDASTEICLGAIINARTGSHLVK